MVQWYRVRRYSPLDLPIMHPVPGHFCSQWLIQRAPLSLQYFNGPIYKHDVAHVLTRYYGANSLRNRPLFLLVANPMDNDNYYNFDYLQD